MNFRRNFILHIILLLLVTCIVWIIFDSEQTHISRSVMSLGEGKYAHGFIVPQQSADHGQTLSIRKQFSGNISGPMGLMLLQIIIILIVSKLFGALVAKISQPKVIGEIIAGIILGPSLLGIVSPEMFSFLFPERSISNLQIISQLGLVFFMFIVGMEFEIGRLKKKVLNALIISNTSIIFPYFLGILSSFFLFRYFASDETKFSAFALFIGISVSITAFPVLAKILQERNLTKTNLGAIAVTCAAFNDLTSWCILGLVIAIVKGGSFIGVLLIIVLTVLFILAMFFAVRPLLERISSSPQEWNNGRKTNLVIVFLVLFSSALLTEVIGIHAIFGAFLAGLIMPDTMGFKEALSRRIEDISTTILLPVFFAVTGLRMQIGLLNDWFLWAVFGMVVLVAMAGKIGGGAISARITGHSWSDALSIGVLMNTRGLMEIIVLSIGYDLGILSSTLFTIMVLMAITTTMMSGPLLELIGYVNRKPESKAPTI